MKNIVLLFLFTLTGCVTAGTKFDSAEVTKIIPCKSNKTELRNKFGNPYNSGILSGLTLDRWSYATIGKGESLVVYYNSADTVVDYTLNADPSYSPKSQCK